MINITFRHDDMYHMYQLKVEGHAGYDEPGKDIVCASVSAITQALAMKLEKMDIAETLIENGYLGIIVSTEKNKSDDKVVKELFDMTVSYLQCIADNYKDNVKLTIK